MLQACSLDIYFFYFVITLANKKILYFKRNNQYTLIQNSSSHKFSKQYLFVEVIFQGLQDVIIQFKRQSQSLKQVRVLETFWHTASYPGSFYSRHHYVSEMSLGTRLFVYVIMSSQCNLVLKILRQKHSISK